MTNVLFEQLVRESLDRSVAAFNEGRPEFFDELTDDAMIVTLDSRQPIDRQTYKQRCEPLETGQRREKTVLSRNVQIMDGKAVATQTSRVVEGGKSVDLLQTLVFGQAGNGVTVLHLHNALLAAKTAYDSLNRPSVQVVNERIATIASVSGVAQ